MRGGAFSLLLWTVGVLHALASQVVTTGVSKTGVPNAVLHTWHFPSAASAGDDVGSVLLWLAAVSGAPMDVQVVAVGEDNAASIATCNDLRKVSSELLHGVPQDTPHGQAYLFNVTSPPTNQPQSLAVVVLYTECLAALPEFTWEMIVTRPSTDHLPVPLPEHHSQPTMFGDVNDHDYSGWADLATLNVDSTSDSALVPIAQVTVQLLTDPRQGGNTPIIPPPVTVHVYDLLATWRPRDACETKAQRSDYSIPVEWDSISKDGVATSSPVVHDIFQVGSNEFARWGVAVSACGTPLNHLNFVLNVQLLGAAPELPVFAGDVWEMDYQKDVIPCTKGSSSCDPEWTRLAQVHLPTGDESTVLSVFEAAITFTVPAQNKAVLPPGAHIAFYDSEEDMNRHGSELECANRLHLARWIHPVTWTASPTVGTYHSQAVVQGIAQLRGRADHWNTALVLCDVTQEAMEGLSFRFSATGLGDLPNVIIHNANGPFSSRESSSSSNATVTILLVVIGMLCLGLVLTVCCKAKSNQFVPNPMPDIRTMTSEMSRVPPATSKPSSALSAAPPATPGGYDMRSINVDRSA